MRVLVCGGREWRGRAAVIRCLDMARPSVVIQGGADGADRLAREWAEMRGVECITYPADWNKYGKGAGPIRNQQMVDDGKPDLVIAFPGGRGTQDMIRRAVKAGIKVLEPYMPGGGDKFADAIAR